MPPSGLPREVCQDTALHVGKFELTDVKVSWLGAALRALRGNVYLSHQRHLWHNAAGNVQSVLCYGTGCSAKRSYTGDWQRVWQAQPSDSHANASLSCVDDIPGGRELRLLYCLPR